MRAVHRPEFWRKTRQWTKTGRKRRGEEKKKGHFTKGGCEATNLENMEALYASIRSWGMEEEGNIPFPSWKGVDEYRDPVDPTSLSANFAAVFLEVESILNSCVEWKVILNAITHENNQIL